ncbi:hypothetical protein M5689_015535 [Euphorbia peplus]|nr:hypothetical protein M5689_015535 [Euphorbia peplus]
MDEPESTPPLQPPLRRRNSIATAVPIPTMLSLPANGNSNGAVPFPPPDFELASLKSSLAYISLKDMLPSSAVSSPTSAVNGSACEISIRNRLVKQAAWAYLQPMSSSPESSSQNFLHRVWIRVSARNPIGACFRFVSVYLIPCITGVFDWIFRRGFGIRVDR